MASPSCFTDSVRWVLEREGVRWNAAGELVATGLVDDPHDPGGLTNFGIAQRWHPDVDVRNLSLAGATALYRTEYWDKFGCGELSDPWALFVFDSAVQHPPSAVARFEQDNALCDALRDREAFYRSLPEFPHFGVGWLTRLSLLRERIATLYGVSCP